MAAVAAAVGVGVDDLQPVDVAGAWGMPPGSLLPRVGAMATRASRMKSPRPRLQGSIRIA